MYKKVMSIGSTCQPSVHIRAQLGQTEAYYFDWMISPVAALVKAVESEFADILLPENLSYSDGRKIRLVDAVNGLEYQHDFPVDKDNLDPAARNIILPDFAAHADAVREKYARRAERTCQLLREGEPVLLVRYVQAGAELSPAARGSFMSVFARKFPTGRFKYLWASPLAKGFQHVDGGFVCTLPPSNKWDGDAEGWRQVFEFCGALKACT